MLFFRAADTGEDTGLIMAGTHGDETAGVVALSCALRALGTEPPRHHVILAVNPDGCQLGLRANARGVDLNRNFPAGNWQPGDTVYRWTRASDARDVVLSTGTAPGSEPETRSLCRLIAQLKPAWAVSFHEPLACIEQQARSPLALWLADRLALPWVEGVGYPTPGSFGSWCDDHALPCITAELPAVSADDATALYLDALAGLLRYRP